jgi:putative ABC transport system permease protein
LSVRSSWRRLAHGLRVLLRRSKADGELDEEIRQFLEHATAAELARGASPAEAKRAARLAFGDGLAIREEVRTHGWEHAVGTVLSDTGYALRGLRRRPGFALVSALTLALGTGASTAIFSAVNAAFIGSLPYPRAGRLVRISDRADGGQRIDVTYGTFHELSERSRSFESLAAMDPWQATLVGTGEPERLPGQLVTGQYFRTLGVRPVVGRDFTEAEDRPGAPRVVILSDALAERRFGGAAAIVGRAVTLDGDDYTVIGVMPPRFENVLAPSAQLWAPRRYRASAPFEGPEWGHHMWMVGRLADGVTFEQAGREIEAIGRAPVDEYARPPWASMEAGLAVESLQASLSRGVRPALLAILGAVALVLAISAVNVTNLLLARGAQRHGEMALRGALGASRARLLRQLLTESLVLAVIGGVLGIGVALLGVRALVALAPAGLPRTSAIRVDATALAFATVLSAVVGVVVGLVPALYGARRDLRAGVEPGARTIGASHHRLRRSLVTAEIALALVLLVGTGLLLRSLRRLLATPPGIDTSNVLTLQVAAAGHRYDDGATTLQFFTQALDAVRQVPGVIDAAFTSQLPLSGDIDGYGVKLESTASTDPNDLSSALRYAVTPGWFGTMRIPLLRGRLLDANDRPGGVEAIVVSESFARNNFPGVDPIGQRFRAGPEVGQPERPWAVVVGVVGDVKQTSLALGGEDAFYVTMGQWPWVDRVQSLAVRTAADPVTLVRAVQRAIWSVDPDQPIIRVATMDALLGRSEAQRRFVLIAFETFGLAALVLAAIGVFGMVSGAVTERMRELAVRSVLGASQSGILLLVLRQGIVMAGAGITLGLAGAALLSGALRTLMFGISRADAVSYAGAAMLIVLVAVLASAIPAWRASRVDPGTTLRA